MEPTAYAIEARIEATHWWFLGRRRLFAREIRAQQLPAVPRILDIGTSTGTNLRMLRELGQRDVTGLDVNDDAIRYCEDKQLGQVRKGNICALPFEPATFDLVLATDVLEHVDDDLLALSEISRVLAPGGKALITVPAFPALWGLQDDVSLHKRRYRLRALLAKIEYAGFKPIKSYYFNYLLFGPIWLARKLMRWLHLRSESEAAINTPTLNKMLSALFTLDVWTAPMLRPPFGVSILVLAEKR